MAIRLFNKSNINNGIKFNRLNQYTNISTEYLIVAGGGGGGGSDGSPGTGGGGAGGLLTGSVLLLPNTSYTIRSNCSHV